MFISFHIPNTQTCSPYFRDYIEVLVRYLVCEKGIRNCRIVEVGCGKGYFLRRLMEEDAGNTAILLQFSPNAEVVKPKQKTGFPPA
jgi:2-polyprenyl-3-methyl-5-hydroxy-6-metoxy-1,4-benzoquinol methylase